MGAFVGLAVVVGLAGWWWAQVEQRPSLEPNSADEHGMSDKQLRIGADGAGADDEGGEDDVAAAGCQEDVLVEEQDQRSQVQGALMGVVQLIASTLLLTAPNG